MTLIFYILKDAWKRVHSFTYRRSSLRRYHVAYLKSWSQTNDLELRHYSKKFNNFFNIKFHKNAKETTFYLISKFIPIITLQLVIFYYNINQFCQQCKKSTPSSNSQLFIYLTLYSQNVHQYHIQLYSLLYSTT